MYIYYSIGNNSGLRTLVCIVEVSVIGESIFGGSTVYNIYIYILYTVFFF